MMDVIGYSTWGDAPHKPIRFSDRTNPHIKRGKVVDCLSRMAEAFNKPSDCIWIVPGTEED
jgi:hypothetical protein